MHDVAPTVVHLFGLPPQETFAGVSLLPIHEYIARPVFAEAIDQKSERGGDIHRDSYSCREGNLKLIHHAFMNSWELYDLAADVGESHNIVTSSAEAERLKGLLAPRVRRWER